MRDEATIVCSFSVQLFAYRDFDFFPRVFLFLSFVLNFPKSKTTMHVRR